MKVYVAITSEHDGRGFDDFINGIVVSVNQTLEGAKRELENMWSIDDGEQLVWDGTK